MEVDGLPTSLKAARRSSVVVVDWRSVARAAESGRTTDVLRRAVKMRRVNNTWDKKGDVDYRG
jgi:hypothetical protein